MKYLTVLLLFLSKICFATNIVTTLPEFKWATEKIGQDHFKVTTFLTGNEDPHFVDATPAFILKAAKAELIIANGLDLEEGWLPKVIQSAGNSKIQLNGQGYCDVSKNINKEQVVQNYNRSMGHLHPAGNPHYTLAIKEFQVAIKTINECLKNLNPEMKNLFDKNTKKIIGELSKLEIKLKKKMAKLSKFNFMTYHQEFIYFLSNFNLKTVGTIEKIPGVLPSASFLFTLKEQAKKQKVKLVLAASTNPEKYLDKFKEMTSIPYVKLPMHMNEKFKSYGDFQSYLVDEILKHAQN